MANNKVVLSDGTVLMDISSDTVTVDTLLSGYTAHDCHGNQITGAATSGGSTSDATATASDIAKGKTAYAKGSKITGAVQEISSGAYTPTGTVANSAVGNDLQLTVGNTKDVLLRSNTNTVVKAPLSDFGNATADDVASGRTFTSASGVKVVGKAGSSSGSLPSEIVAGDTPIWSKSCNVSTNSSSTSVKQLFSGSSVYFKAPKSGTYRFKFTGWTNATNGEKYARVYLSLASNKQTDPDGVTWWKDLPLSNATDLTVHIDAELTEGQRIFFFGQTASGQFTGMTGPVGKIYNIQACIAWDNGTNQP